MFGPVLAVLSKNSQSGPIQLAKTVKALLVLLATVIANP